MSAPRVVIIGAGFAGFHAARRLRRHLDDIEISLINPTDYFLYLPLLPEVAGGVLEPRRICVSLTTQLPGVRLLLGAADTVDLERRTVAWTDVDGRRSHAAYDRLIFASGSENKLLPIPGIAQNAHGFRNIAEALSLRDHITHQLELAAATNDQDERDARCTFVVVGAGYTGTEVAAQGQLLTRRLTRQLPALRRRPLRWMLADLADRVLPELSPRLSRTADRVLRARGIELKLRQSIEHAEPDAVVLTTGERIATRSLIWCVGVQPDALVSRLGLPTTRGRLDVDATLQVKAYPDVFAVGDSAGVPDLTRPGQLTGMTAQHAQRQGRAVARNVAASLTGRPLTAYRHRNLGFLIDLGGSQAAANPLHVPMSGFAAKAVTRGYHLVSLPGNRSRVALDWAVNAVMPPHVMQLGMIDASRVPLACTTAAAAGAPATGR